jgi:hypothetical protein
MITDSPTTSMRPGELSLGWRWAVAVSWSAIMVSIVVVAGSAEVINRSVWWIGNRDDRAPIVLALVPFIVPALVVVAANRSWRHVVQWSFAASASTLLVAIGDRSQSPSAAIVIAALAVAGLCVSIAATSGRARTRV